MSQKITVKCPTCHHSFEVDLDDYEPVQTIYRTNAETPQREVEYRFKCPKDGTFFIERITFSGED